MNSFVQRAEQLADSELKQVRWALGINGALSIAFAAVILIWPGISLFALTILFGAFTAASGIMGLASAIRGSVKQGRGWLAFTSLLQIAVGVVVFIWTDMSALALLYVIGFYAVALGALIIVGALSLPFDTGDKAMLALGGVISIVFGVVMFAKPGDGAIVLLALIAAFSLVTGVSELAVAFGGRKLIERDIRRSLAMRQPGQQRQPQPSA
jgi:uncharacterized membrane protein HdeD (DUF308 family)